MLPYLVLSFDWFCFTISRVATVSRGCGGVGVSEEDDSEGARQVIDSVSSHIAGVDVARGRNQICREKAKKRVNFVISSHMGESGGNRV